MMATEFQNEFPERQLVASQVTNNRQLPNNPLLPIYGLWNRRTKFHIDH